MKHQHMRAALQSIARDAARARIGEDDERRNALRIEIGLAPPKGASDDSMRDEEMAHMVDEDEED